MTAAMAPNRRSWSTWRELPDLISAPANVKRTMKRRLAAMPFVNVKLNEGVFTPDQK